MTVKHNAVARSVKAGAAWQPDSSRSRLLAGGLLALYAVYAAVFFWLTVQRLAAQPAHGDFFALWSAARFAATHGAVAVYDSARLRAAQLALGMAASSDYPFPYPPFFLLLLWPLSRLSYLPAYGLAIGGTLALYVWAAVGRCWRAPIVAAALLAPTTTITIVAGQAGFLGAALLIGGFRLIERRPIAGGILFGLLSYKPQLGLLVPVALVAAGKWRTMIAAGATLAALVTASLLLFGWGVWPAWAAALRPYAGEFASATGAGLDHLMPTVATAAGQLGAGPEGGAALQVVAAAISAGAVWRCFRRGTTPLATATLLVAMFLATPHAFVYDLPPVTTAVLWLIAERQRAAAAFTTYEVAIMTLAMLAPITLVAGPAGPPIMVLSLALLLVLIVRRCRIAAAA
jgi:hypothetical protein